MEAVHLHLRLHHFYFIFICICYHYYFTFTCIYSLTTGESRCFALSVFIYVFFIDTIRSLF